MSAAAPRLWLGLDLGATNAKAALVSDDGVVLATHDIPLSDDKTPDAVVELLLQCSRACLDAQSPPLTFAAVAAIGVGCPGKCNPNGTVEGIANFPWPPGTPLAPLIEARAGRPVFLTNDADAVVAAENWVGIGKRVRDFVVLTLGSGVGCGIVNDGVMLQGCSGNIEGGHMIVQAEGGRPCGCGSRGCLEAYTSANSVVRLATEALDDDEDGKDGAPRSTLHQLRETQGAVSCKDVFAAAARNDALALSVVDRVARVLAVGCINLSRTVDTETIAFTGGMVAAGDFLLDKVRAAIAAQTWTCLPTPFTLQLCEAGPTAGLVGSAAVARLRHAQQGATEATGAEPAADGAAPAPEKETAAPLFVGTCRGGLVQVRSAVLAAAAIGLLHVAAGFVIYRKLRNSK